MKLAASRPSTTGWNYVMTIRVGRGQHNLYSKRFGQVFFRLHFLEQRRDPYMPIQIALGGRSNGL